MIFILKDINFIILGRKREREGETKSGVRQRGGVYERGRRETTIEREKRGREMW